MRKTFYSGVDESIMNIETSFSDRFVESYYFIPLNLTADNGKPAITFSQMKHLRHYFKAIHRRRALPDNILKERIFEVFDALQNSNPQHLSQILVKNNIRIKRNHKYIPVVSNGGVSESNQINLQCFLNSLKSELGYVFFDRTRIRPKGFAIGEHIYTMSLAPNEEVIIEQKTFSKREATLEEQSEYDVNFDLELSSTLSTEIQEGMEKQQNESQNTKYGINGSVSGMYKGVNFEVCPSYAEDITDASSRIARESIKKSNSTSNKVASKYRAQHKITFKVSTEERFESSSKRTLKNPNKYTPIDLHYFKILNKLEMTQERYGVRLCWTPTVQDPAFDLYERIRKGKEDIIKRYESAMVIPPKPIEPIKREYPPIYRSSGEFEAKDWGFTNDMSQDYTVEIDIPENYIWNGDSEYIKNSFRMRTVSVDSDRKPSSCIVGEPWADYAAKRLKARVHVGCGSDIFKQGHIYVSYSAVFIASPNTNDADYQAAYTSWKQEMTQWQEKVNLERAKARKDAEEEIVAFEDDILNKYNPTNEILSRIIKVFFPTEVRDSVWEIELWNQIFDWSLAYYELYPGWWTNMPLRDSTAIPNSFLNASYARLYLPIKIGHEKTASKMIFSGLSSANELFKNQGTEQVIEKLINDIESYRRSNFGENEVDLQNNGELNSKHQVLGKWIEYLPTDGTHIEISQGMSCACDQYNQAEFDNIDAINKEVIKEQAQNVELKKAALQKMNSVDVKLLIDTCNSNEKI